MGLLSFMKQIYTHFKHIHKCIKIFFFQKYESKIFTNNNNQLIKVLYNSAQGLSRKQINEIERNKTTINKFCNFFITIEG